MPSRLLAKRPSAGVEVTLPSHALAVSQAARALFGQPGAPTPLGERWLRFFGVGAEHAARFHAHVLLASVLHDIGKANAGFQAAVTGRGEQVFRHEHLSGLLLWEPTLRGWLVSGDGIVPEVVVSAVVSHHHKVNHEEMAKPCIPLVGAQLFCDHQDFMETLKLSRPILLDPPPPGLLPESYEPGVNLEGPLETFRADFYRFKRRVRGDEPLRRFLLSVKAALLAADAAGSGLFREGIPPEAWVSSCFGGEDLRGEVVEEKVLLPRIAELEERRGSPFSWHDFQLEAGNLGPRALLLAGCGSGKTLAAWRWIRAQADGRPIRRAIFLYPTRATATEGFRDYVSWAGGEDAALIHGTAAYDLRGLFSNPGDERGGEDYSTMERLFAIGYWPKRFISATVDSFLGFMAHQYASACLLPLLADSAVVVDEVHSFSPSMFTALERFLGHFDVPVLCMTATLTSDRLAILRDRCNIRLFPSDPAKFGDLKAQQEAPRYRVVKGTPNSAQAMVRGALEGGGLVLWVSNTVGRCQRAALDHEEWCRERGIPLRCYHSRFRLMDRRQRHEEVIALFRERRRARGAALVATTQVCQMSLDLDADLVVTEVAPVPDLIQRMGRCCREPHPGERRGTVFGYPPPDPKPYSPEELAQGDAFLRDMASRPEVSQLDMARHLESMAVAAPQLPEGYAGFLDSAWFAMARDDRFRDGQEFTEDCVLDSDLEAYLAASRKKQPCEGFILPVPKRFASDQPALGQRLKEAKGERYHPELGFMTETAHG